jgi:hypothetical protein
MHIAYIISAYKYPEQLVRLVDRLDRRGASFWLHVDRRSDDAVYEWAVERLGARENVHFLTRHACNWGDFGHVRATLKGIRALRQARTPFDYAILLTGQDYPIQSNGAIAAYLQQHNGRAFIHHFPLPSDEWGDGGLDRIRYRHWRLWNRHIVLPIPRSFPQGLAPYGGSSYWCLPRPCIEYIETFIQERPDFVRFFHRVDVPDEIFFQTILLNSPFKECVVNDDLRYIDWKDWNAGSPGILVQEDFEAIARSSKLFARKFDMTIDAHILDLIDRKNEQQTQSAGYIGGTSDANE